MHSFDQRGTTHLLLILIILIGIIAGVYLSLNRTAFLPKASEGINFSATGRIDAGYLDFFDPKKGQEVYLFKPDGSDREYILELDKRLPISSGTKVNLSGNLTSGSRISARIDQINFLEQGIKPITSGQFKLGVIRVNIPDGSIKTDPALMPTIGELDRILGTNGMISKKYYLENSYGSLSFEGEILETIEIDDPIIYTESQGGYKMCRIPQPVTDAVERKIGAEKLSQFSHLMFVMPLKSADSDCPAGVGMYGPQEDGKTRSWILQNVNNIGLYAHELGHNLGLGHSSLMACRASSPRTYYDCTFSEYGEEVSAMGYMPADNNTSFHFNAPHKYGLGWLSRANSGKGVLEIDKIASEKTYKLAPLESQDVNALKVIKIKVKKDLNSDWGRIIEEEFPYYSIPLPWKAMDEFVYISYRQPVGMDWTLGSEITQGASIHSFSGELRHLTTLWDIDPIYLYGSTPDAGVGSPPTPPNTSTTTPASTSSAKPKLGTMSMCDKESDPGCFKDKFYYQSDNFVIEQVRHNKDFVEVKIYPERPQSSSRPLPIE